VVFLCLGGSAWAGKPKIAILGLEAAPGPSGTVDPETTQVARDVTKELRQRAQSGASPYTVAPNSSKELADEKLLMSCDNEAMSCMAVIGAGLAADVLLYGRVERKGEVYRVSLKLLDVKAKTAEAGGDEMPVGGSVTGLSKRLYSKLIGDGPSLGGTLILKARSQTGAAINSGKVVIDEEPKGDLAGGRLTVTGLAEGRHTLAIEAAGYQRFQETVTVHAGEQASLDAVLLEKSGQPSTPASPPSTLFWKVSLGLSIAVAAGGGGYSIYSYTRQNRQLEQNILQIMGENLASVGSGDCGKTEMEILENSNPKVTSFNYPALQSACKWGTQIYVGFAVGAIGVVGAVTSLIMLSRDAGPAEKQATGARARKPEVAIVPMFTPDGGGASLSVTW
jgi:hypothetical protein